MSDVVQLYCNGSHYPFVWCFWLYFVVVVFSCCFVIASFVFVIVFELASRMCAFIYEFVFSGNVWWWWWCRPCTRTSISVFNILVCVQFHTLLYECVCSIVLFSFITLSSLSYFVINYCSRLPIGRLQFKMNHYL